MYKTGYKYNEQDNKKGRKNGKGLELKELIIITNDPLFVFLIYLWQLYITREKKGIEEEKGIKSSDYIL